MNLSSEVVGLWAHCQTLLRNVTFHNENKELNLSHSERRDETGKNPTYAKKANGETTITPCPSLIRFEREIE